MIIDLKKSRKYRLETRNDIQGYILHVIQVLNEVFGNSIVKEVSFSAGDEVQGLFDSVEASYLYFRMFSMLVSPVEIRAGIGVGGWDVVVKEAGTTAQDGTAYHNARKAINATEELLGYSVLLFSERNTDMVVNSLLNATALIINKQSQYQNEMMLFSELLYPIVAYNIVDVGKLHMIIDLVRYKSSFIRCNFLSNAKNSKLSLFYELDNFDFECRPIDVMADDDAFFVVTGKTRGLPTQISEIIGITRQSVDKTIKSANIYEARNMAVATLKYIRSIWRYI